MCVSGVDLNVIPGDSLQPAACDRPVSPVPCAHSFNVKPLQAQGRANQSIHQVPALSARAVVVKGGCLPGEGRCLAHDYMVRRPAAEKVLNVHIVKWRGQMKFETHPSVRFSGCLRVCVCLYMGLC